MAQNEFCHDKGLSLFKNVCDWFRIKLGITTSLILGHSVKTIKLEIDKYSYSCRTVGEVDVLEQVFQELWRRISLSVPAL